LRADWTQTFGQVCGIVDIEKQQHFFLDYRAVIGAEHQMKQGFYPNKMNGSHNDNADH